MNQAALKTNPSLETSTNSADRNTNNILNAIAEARKSLIDSLATLKDLHEVETRLNKKIGKVETRLNKKIGKVETRLSGEMREVEVGLNKRMDGIVSEIGDLKSEIHKANLITTRWMIGVVVALATLIAIVVAGPILP